MRSNPSCLLAIVLLSLQFYIACNDSRSSAAEANTVDAARYRGPVDLVLDSQETWAATVNELSGTVSLIDLGTACVKDEFHVGGKPGAIAIIADDELLVSCRESGLLHRLRVRNDRVEAVGAIQLGFDPLGIATNSSTAYVGLQATGEIAEVDLSTNNVVRRIAVGRWPRYLTLSPDGKRLAVGLSGDSSIAILDTNTGDVLYDEPISGGINIGHLQTSADGTQVYFPWMVYRSNPITVRDIQRGWVLASRVARVRLDGPAYREAISLDVPRLAVADPHGLVITPDEKRLAVTSSGTHELLVYRLGDLPFVGSGGPGDLIDERLLRDNDLFHRIELGGRPLGIHAAADNETIFVANHLKDCLQVVNLSTRTVVQTVSLGPRPDDAEAQLVHRGMEIFYDARRSLDQWYSCNSCHLDGGSNAKAMDTWNDGTELTPKSVLSLLNVTETGPWTWHGWQNDLDASLQNSFVSTMQGEKASAEDIRALRTYLSTLRSSPSPFLQPDGSLNESALRGRELFQSSSVGCSDCHAGPRFTDGQIHEVGMIRETDKYAGYNTPSLIGVHRKTRLLHDGRARDLESVLTKWHTPQEIGGGAELSEQQLRDLIEYLKTL